MPRSHAFVKLSLRCCDHLRGKILLDISQRKPSTIQRHCAFGGGATLAIRSKILARCERLSAKARARTRKYLCRRGFWHYRFKKIWRVARSPHSQTTPRFLTTHQHVGNHPLISCAAPSPSRERPMALRALKKLPRPPPCVFLQSRTDIRGARSVTRIGSALIGRMRTAIYCPQGTS